MLAQLLIAAALQVGTGLAPGSSGDCALADCWRLVAASDLVVVGELVLPPASGRSEAARDPYDYFDLRIHVHRVLKGDGTTDSDLLARYAKEPSPPSPAWQQVNALGGTEVVALLAYVDSPGTPGLYFARSAKGCCPAIMAATGERESALVSELRKERDIARDEGLLARQHEFPVFRQVQKLVADLPHCGRQERAHSELQSLGPRAVPALIALMDDRRRLCAQHAAVKTSASGFESVALYSPEVVADLLSITLTSLTGESFGSLANGASERIRTRVIKAWRTYLARVAAE